MNKKYMKRNAFLVNFIAGGVGGTAGVFVTCPLDVVQTRFQSSVVKKLKPSSPQLLNTAVVGNGGGAAIIDISSRPFGLQVYSYVRHIVRTEGFAALYKGLVPNLAGIFPSRAIYFTIYTKTKHFLCSTSLSHSSWTHMLSALSASWSVSTITNPIWFVKTRLQLDLTESGKRRTVHEVIKEELSNSGIRGFYRGLSASYIGASETVAYFVIYERFKLMLASQNRDLSPLDYAYSAFISKSIATVSFYPHEVARTRLRQEATKKNCQKLYYGFFQTLKQVYKDEGWVGLYGGMGAHLMRQVPNTVIMFLTYESIVNFLTRD